MLVGIQPPYAHHFGGAWERLIGFCRRILNAMLLENRSKDLTLDVLSTVVPLYIAPRYIATLAYRHEIVKNGFPPMLIPPL